MSIETEYRGHKITYSSNGDEWYCPDLDGKWKSHAKLSKLREAIDKMYLDQRKAASVPALELSTMSPAAIEVNVTEYLGTMRARHWNGQPLPDKHLVAAVGFREQSQKVTRREVEMSGLAPDTEDARAAINIYVTLKKQEHALKKQAEAAYAAIPRLQPADIQALVDLHAKMKLEGAA